jgi:hypothetical protein
MGERPTCDGDDDGEGDGDGDNDGDNDGDDGTNIYRQR